MLFHSDYEVLIRRQIFVPKILLLFLLLKRPSFSQCLLSYRCTENKANAAMRVTKMQRNITSLMLCYRTTISANCKFYAWTSCFQFLPMSVNKGRGSTSGVSEELPDKCTGAVLKPRHCNGSLALRHKAFHCFTLTSFKACLHLYVRKFLSVFSSNVIQNKVPC